MVKAKKIICAKKFEGFPKLEDFEVVEENLSELEEDEFLVEGKYNSIDAGVRAYMDFYPAGSMMIGSQVGTVIESRNIKFPVGCDVFGHFGWRTHTVVNPAKVTHQIKPYVLPNFGSNPLSLGLVLGITGNTAYFGFLEICQPKAGETVVITGAAGAVGILVGQIAKLKGCYVVGIAGSDDKCAMLKNELGFDSVINYKRGELAENLKQAAPRGVDCYFDNVGGEISSIIFSQMNLYGRVSICGAISGYNNKHSTKVAPIQATCIFKQLKLEGFVVYRWADRWMEGVTQMLEWVNEGKIKYRETVTEGFENAPQAFIDLLNGKNIGKSVVKLI